MTQSRCILLAVLATLAAPVQAQTTPEEWSNLAAGADDFMPAAPDTPLDELMTDDFLVPPDSEGPGVLDAPGAPADDFGASSVPEAGAVATPPPSAGPEADTGAFPATDVPADWVEHTRLGVTFRTPPDWAVVEDEDDGLMVGRMDEATRVGVSFGAALERENGLDDLPPGAVVTELPEVDLGAGVAFRHRSIEAEIEGTAVFGHVLISTEPYERDKYLMIMSIGVGGDLAATTRQIEMALSTVAVAPFPGAPGQADAGPQSGFGGLVDFTLPAGWQVMSNQSEFMSFVTTPNYSAYVTIETGEYARQTLDSEGFDAAPTVSRSEILGEPARLSAGMTATPELVGNAAMVKGEKRIYLLDRCLGNAVPVVISLVGAPGWVASDGFAPLLSALSLTLPADAAPCGAPATPTPEQGSVAPSAVIAAPTPEPDTVGQEMSAISPDGRVIFPQNGLGGWSGENATLSNRGAESADGVSFLFAKTADDGRVGYFVAPQTILGDWSGYGGLRLVLATFKGAYFGARDFGGIGDIGIANGEMTASAVFDRPVGGNWTEINLRFKGAKWVLSGGAKSIAEVLADVTDFRIRAEYVRGESGASLREIGFLPGVVEVAPEPEVWTTVGEVLTQSLNSIAAVQSGPGQASVLVFKMPVLVQAITTYHWNRGRGAVPGTIALRDQTGVVFGPWNAYATDGQGGAPNAYWHVEPNVSLPPGQYTIIDSDPSSWATNAEVGDRGIFDVRYQRIARAAPATAP